MASPTELYEEHPEAFLPIFDRWADDAEDQVEEMLARLDEAYDTSPTSVLDVGCGIGRHSIELAQRGIEAHGLDISGVYIDRAEERAASAGVSDDTRFMQKDMRELNDLSGTYDLLINVWTSFGFFEEATNKQVLESFRDRLNQGGVLVLEVPNKDGFLTDWAGGSVGKPREDAVHAEMHEYDPATSRVTVTVFAIEEETYLGEAAFETRLYSPIDLQQLVDEAGFRDVKLYGGFGGEELARDSRRLLVLGRK